MGAYKPEGNKPMSDNGAVLAGFTKGFIAEAGDINMYILVKPDTDLDDRFKAWDTDSQEFIHINGWLFNFEPVED